MRRASSFCRQIVVNATASIQRPVIQSGHDDDKTTTRNQKGEIVQSIMESVQVGDFSRNSKEVIEKVKKSPCVLRRGSEPVMVLVSAEKWENAVSQERDVFDYALGVIKSSVQEHYGDNDIPIGASWLELAAQIISEK